MMGLDLSQGIALFGGYNESGPWAENVFLIVSIDPKS